MTLPSLFEPLGEWTWSVHRRFRARPVGSRRSVVQQLRQNTVAFGLAILGTEPVDDTAKSSSPEVSSQPGTIAPLAPSVSAAVTVPTSVDPAPNGGGLAAFRPIFEADMGEAGWLKISVESKDDTSFTAAESALQSHDPARLWRGNRVIPAEIRELPILYAVSTTGVARLEEFAWVGPSPCGHAGILVAAYRRGAARGPMIVVSSQPAEGTKTTKSPKPRRAKSSDAMVRLFHEVLPAEERERLAPFERRRTVTFEVQITPGRFRGAHRLVVVNASNSVGDEYEVGTSALFTVSEDAKVVDILGAGRGLEMTVDMTFDLDGDEVDEFVVSSWGYEFGADTLHRFTPNGMETIGLYEHNE